MLNVIIRSISKNLLKEFPKRFNFIRNKFSNLNKIISPETNPKAIIFDLGGVILNIDYKLTIDTFKKLGIENATSFYGKKVQHPIFDKIEVGEVRPKAFLEFLQKESRKASLREVKNAWNAMLLDLPQKRLEVIKKLKNNKDIEVFREMCRKAKK